MMRRRVALSGLALTAGATLVSVSCAGGSSGGTRRQGQSERTQPSAPDPEEDPGSLLDAALTRLHATDPEFDGGLSNHGPMAAEALEALGAPERIPSFVDAYASRLTVMPVASPLTGDDWRGALGKSEARAALIATMEERLRDGEPSQIVAEMVDVLAPGVIAAAFHGLLRVAHGIRAWERHGSVARRVELAHGLGYWASRYQTIPGEPGRSPRAGRGPLTALAEVPLVDTSERRGGLIFERFAVLEGRADFVQAVESFDPDARSPEEALDELVLASARLYLGSSGSPQFVYLHGITGSAALRLLLPGLPELSQRRVVAHQFAALAAVHATHGQPGQSLDAVETVPSLTPDAIVSRAAASHDDHTIKLVEAALREHRRSGAPELLAVAAHRVDTHG